MSRVRAGPGARRGWLKGVETQVWGSWSGQGPGRNVASSQPWTEPIGGEELKPFHNPQPQPGSPPNPHTFLLSPGTAGLHLGGVIQHPLAKPEVLSAESQRALRAKEELDSYAPSFEGEQPQVPDPQARSLCFFQPCAGVEGRNLLLAGHQPIRAVCSAATPATQQMSQVLQITKQAAPWLVPGPLSALSSLSAMLQLSLLLSEATQNPRFHHQNQLTPPHGRRRNPSTLQTRPETVAHTSPTSEVNNWKEISTVGASPLMVFRLVSWAREEDGDGCGHGSDTTILSHLWFWGHQEGADKRQDQVPP